MKTINVGVVGVGAMGENHVRVYHKMEEANLIAVSDVSERALKKIEKKYGAKGFTEYSDLLENPEIEAVSVCVPTTFHHAVVMEAIKNKKHVLVEKPIAFTVEEAEEMILKTITGTALMKEDQSVSNEEIINKVATKKGITQEGVDLLDKKFGKISKDLIRTLLNRYDEVKDDMDKTYLKK